MTNLEKSIELSKKHEDLRGIRNFEECIVAACQDMAEWKDKQFSVERQQLIEKANQAVTQSFENGANFKKQNMVDKACEWLKTMMQGHIVLEVLTGEHYEANLIKDFKKAMEE